MVESNSALGNKYPGLGIQTSAFSQAAGNTKEGANEKLKLLPNIVTDNNSDFENEDEDNSNQIRMVPDHYSTNSASVTPINPSAPMFGKFSELPTPMDYSPGANKFASPSPSKDKNRLRSPNLGQLNISKIRLDPALVRKFDDDIADNNNNSIYQQRVISELPPLPFGIRQRISSLPTVNESNDIPETHKVVEEEEEEDSFNTKSEELFGYMVDDFGKKLKFKKIKVIGEGNFSTVYLYEAIGSTSLQQVAVKTIKYPEELNNPELRGTSVYKDIMSRFETSLTRELTVLKKIEHPCIVKLYAIDNPIFFESKKPIQDILSKHTTLPPCNLICSYCSGGDLLGAAISKSGHLDSWFIQRIFTELTLAVKYLHSLDIIHRDLKLENILLKYPIDTIMEMKRTNRDKLNNESLIELADFGLCKNLESGEMCTARCGSEDYVSPEILMGINYDGKLSDSWAMGVILYGLLEDRLPFDPLPNANTRQRSRSTAHRIAMFEWKWLKMSTIESNSKEIVQHTLTRKTSRWTTEQIYNSAYIQEEVSNLNFI